MNWLIKLERAIEERLEGQDSRHPLELARQVWGLLCSHPRPAGLCPNRLYLPGALTPPVLEELARHIQERGWQLPGPLHVREGRDLEVGYANGPLERRARAVACVEAGMSEGKRSLFRDDLLIGRSEEAGLRLGDPQVSRRHCRLILEGRDLYLEQAGQRTRLKSGQSFEVGANRIAAYLLSG